MGDIVVSVGFHSTLTLHTKLHLLIGSTFPSTPGYVAPLGLFWWVRVALNLGSIGVLRVDDEEIYD